MFTSNPCFQTWKLLGFLKKERALTFSESVATVNWTSNLPCFCCNQTRCGHSVKCHSNQSSFQMEWGKVESCYFRDHGHRVFRLERRGSIQYLISSQFQSLHLWWCRNTLVPMELTTCTSGKAPSMQRHMYKFESNLCSHSNYFFSEGFAYFNKTIVIFQSKSDSNHWEMRIKRNPNHVCFHQKYGLWWKLLSRTSFLTMQSMVYQTPGYTFPHGALDICWHSSAVYGYLFLLN